MPATHAFRVISTLGPASATREFASTCARLGHPCFRLNGSHMTDEQLQEHVELLDDVLGPFRWHAALDLQGGKRRIGELPGPLGVEAGEEIALVLGDPGLRDIPVPWPDLLAGTREGDRIVLQDGIVVLEVLKSAPERLQATARKGGTLRSGCGIHVDGRSFAIGELPEDQRRQVALAAELGLDGLALSYVADASEMKALRAVCEELDYRPDLIAKIERPEAFETLEAIAEAANEIWLCRGDLGSLVPLGRLGALQERALDVAAKVGCRVVIAGQVFHHMTDHREPTRSEVVHLHDIRARGAVGIVLSDETAIGVDPVGAVETIASLLRFE